MADERGLVPIGVISDTFPPGHQFLFALGRQSSKATHCTMTTNATIPINASHDMYVT